MRSTGHEQKPRSSLTYVAWIAGGAILLNSLAMWIAYFAAPNVDESPGPPSYGLALGLGLVAAFFTVPIAAFAIALAATAGHENSWKRAGWRVIVSSAMLIWGATFVLQMSPLAEFVSPGWCFLIGLTGFPIGAAMIVYGAYQEACKPYPPAADRGPASLRENPR
jgi:hypothetical protein